MSDKNIPEICDYDCPFADFPPADTAGICRTMSAVWCKKLKELVYKNTPCEWRQRGKAGAKKTTRKKTAGKAAAKRGTAKKGERKAATRKTTKRKSAKR